MRYLKEQVEKVKTVKEIFEENPEMKISSFPRDEFLQKANELIELDSQVDTLKFKLFEEEFKRNNLFTEVSESLTKAVDLIKLFFGANSKELKKAGRKVTLERKKAVKRTTEERLAEALATVEKLQAELDKKNSEGK